MNTIDGSKADLDALHLADRIRNSAAAAVAKSALLVLRTAKRYAPVSPTQAQINASLKRKKRSKRKALPGGLEKSIMMEYDFLTASVFVPTNSPAAAYAKKIHDQKFIKWRKRGMGTRRKGDKADEKFIERAFVDEDANIRKIFDKALEEAMK